MTPLSLWVSFLPYSVLTIGVRAILRIDAKMIACIIFAILLVGLAAMLFKNKIFRRQEAAPIKQSAFLIAFTMVGKMAYLIGIPMVGANLLGNYVGS